MARITNKSGRRLHLPRRRQDGAMVSPSLPDGESCEVPGWYVEEIMSERGLAERMSRGELVVTDFEPAADPKGDPETLDGIAIHDAEPLIAAATDPELLTRWFDADDRKGIHERITERIEELTTS